MDPVGFFRELKRRSVFRVAAVYGLVAWVLVQVSATAFPYLGLPDWAVTLVIVLTLLFFPLALVLAWAFDLTPEGVKRATPAPRDAGAPAGRPARPLVPRPVVYVGLALMVGAGSVFFVRRGVPDQVGVAGPDGEAADLSVVVMPFVNMGGDPGQDHFADGITEDLITNLSRIEGLRVISRASAMRYRGTDRTAPEIARELGVGYVLAGSVRREGDAVRISAQLVDAARDSHLWAERYDREVTAVFEVQGDIAHRIAAALAQRLSPEDAAWIARGGTDDATAYDLLLRGREYLNRPGATDLRKYPPAMSFFRQAMAADPGYARAYAAMAEAFRKNPALPLIPVTRDSVLHYAGRAAELDPASQDAATELGYGQLFAGDLAAAERAFGRALELDPNQADALMGIARIHLLRGRLDESVRWHRRAVGVDPLSPEALLALGQRLFDLGDLDMAEAQFRRALALAPDFPPAADLLAQSQVIRGDDRAAERTIQALRDIAGDHPGTHLAIARVRAFQGRYAEADAVVAASPMGDAPAARVFRAVLAKLAGDDARAAELFRAPGELLASWEAAGLSIPPRARLDRYFLQDDSDGMLTTLRDHWRTGLSWATDPPQSGIYFIDQDPVMAGLREDRRFTRLLAEMRAELDSLRAAVAAQL